MSYNDLSPIYRTFVLKLTITYNHFKILSFVTNLSKHVLEALNHPKWMEAVEEEMSALE